MTSETRLVWSGRRPIFRNDPLNPVALQSFRALRPALPLAIGLACATAAAFLAPGFGASGGALRTELLLPWAVAFIFLVQGFQLPGREALAGLAAWPLHLFCLAWMFVVVPVLALLLLLVFGDALTPVARAGILYLSILPTTIATNAAFSSKAGGNAGVVLTSIVAANAIGVFLSPAVFAWLLTGGTGARVDSGSLAAGIFLQIIAPFLAGQLLRVRFAAAAEAGKGLLRESSSLMVYFIVYVSLCNFLAEVDFVESLGGSSAMVAATLLLLLGSAGFCWLALRALPFPAPFRVAAFYSASQKGLAAGLPIANAVYSGCVGDGLPPLALLVLPLILFHFCQLVLGALLIPFLARAK